MPTEWSNIAHCAPDDEITGYELLLSSVSIPRATFHRDVQPQVTKPYPQEISVQRDPSDSSAQSAPLNRASKSSGTTTRGSSKKKALPTSSAKKSPQNREETKATKGKVDRPLPWAPFTRRARDSPSCSCLSRLWNFRAVHFLPFVLRRMIARSP